MNVKAIEQMLYLIEKYKQNRADVLGDNILREDIRRKFLINIFKNEYIDIEFVTEFKDLFLLEKELTVLHVKDVLKITEFKNYNRTLLINCLYNNININTIKNCYTLLKEEERLKLIKIYELDDNILNYILDVENNEYIKKILKAYQKTGEDS